MNLLDPIEWSIVLLLMGCGLLVMEVFIPSGGLLGFFATLSLVASIVVAFRQDFTTGLTFTTIALFAAPLAVGLAFKYWPKTPMGKAFLGQLPSEEETLVEDPRRSLVGRYGVARTKMLPSGSVLVDDQLVDAVSKSGAIDPGQSVLVVDVQGNRVMVRTAEPPSSPTPENRDDLLAKPIEDFGLESIDEPLA